MASEDASGGSRPTAAQERYLARGVAQPGGKLPLFDEQGRRIDRKTVESCIERGWAEPWFSNPTKPDWLICRLTQAGFAALARGGPEGTPGPSPSAPNGSRWWR